MRILEEIKRDLDNDAYKHLMVIRSMMKEAKSKTHDSVEYKYVKQWNDEIRTVQHYAQYSRECLGKLKAAQRAV